MTDPNVASFAGVYRMNSRIRFSRLLRRRYGIVLLSLFICIGCAGTANRVMTGYARMKVANSNLGVVLIKKNIQIFNPEDVARDLGNNGPEEAYYNFFATEFPAEMGACSRFRSVCFVAGADDMLTQREMSKLDDGTVRAALPMQRDFVSDSLHYLLIIDFLTISHMRKTNTSVSGGSDGNFAGFFSGSECLTHSANFVVWDNKAATIAAYGNIGEKVSVFDTMTKTIWTDMLKNIAHAVCAGMPYRK
jgi:hypothetical protein